MLAGVSTSHLGRIEAGSAKAPPIVIVQMSRALGIGAERMAAICAAGAMAGASTEASS